jgi:hypothetical protein
MKNLHHWDGDRSTLRPRVIGVGTGLAIGAGREDFLAPHRITLTSILGR